MLVSSVATPFETIRRRFHAGRGDPPMWSTRCGCTQTPRFATAAYAAAICTGVTAIPWPMGTFPIVAPVHWDGGRTMPAVSPG